MPRTTIRRPGFIITLGAVLFGLALGSSAAEPRIRIDADFPGGNIVVDSIAGDTVTLHQDLRDTAGNWFYWCFRVRGAAGRTLRFGFSESNPIGTRGPALSLDSGKSWTWLGTNAVQGKEFSCAIPRGAREARFCFAIPYLEGNLKEFLKRHSRHPNLKVESLCRTPKGRRVELLRLGRLDGKAEHAVLLTCRHHACEMIASYSLEGIMEAVLDADEGRRLREQVEFFVVPFMDKDGVEDGDQGKNRKPHDHNRDYDGNSLYASVRAVRELVAGRLGSRKIALALDMHCPHIRGARNEHIYFVGGPEPENWARVGEFSEVLQTVRRGPLRYRSSDNLPHGQAWNTLSGPPRSFGQWAAAQPNVLIGTSIEIPYANVGKTTVTAENARAFGHDLARAMDQYLLPPSTSASR
ncbi:MAG TPA: M14 family zinc carboxypeptidase [Candidatus Paceibacterota bacterium]|nr:M14 family zinc carboxypeptidase [Verrucomicrobiota bacterium]HSA12659.1 M14 family zinc carboxypeptidase [Candidatus Paceibacterota bacterium]